MALNIPKAGLCNVLYQPDKRDSEWALYCERETHDDREHQATDPRTGAHVHWRR